mgnify:CR=1 FL=1
MEVILIDIRSVFNVGSIFRSADALGFSHIYLSGITPTPLDRFGNYRDDFKKTSLGAEKNVSWSNETKNLNEIKKLISDLKKKGHIVIALETGAKFLEYYKFKPSSNKNKIVFIIGNEVKGLPSQILRLANKTLKIPMKGKKESLNVGIAFAVVAYHFRYVLSLK